MTVSRFFLTVFLLFSVLTLHPESFRVVIDKTISINVDNAAGSTVSAGIDSALLINLGEETRFFRGIEIEISAPQAWLKYNNSAAMEIYNNILPKDASGTADIDASRAFFDLLPGKLKTIYQIPLRASHGLRTTSYVTVGQSVVPVNTFPVLFTLTSLAKGITPELEQMKFDITIKPIFTDEGAVRLITREPPQLRGKPFTALIDDELIDNLADQIILKEGEHHLVILSDEYRNESRRFVIERAKVLDLIVELQDPSPLIIFEAPQNALVYLNNVPVKQTHEPIIVEPGQHEAKFQVGDYTITRTLTIQRGKTYRVALEVDLTIDEID